MARVRIAALIAIVAALAVVAVGCGGSSSAEPTPADSGDRFKVGLVTDVGGLNDRSFNHLANLGLTRAEQELGVDGRVLISRSNAEYVPNLSTLARQGHDLVIGVGFLMADAIDTVAARFPDTSFAIIDYPVEALKGKPQNVEGLLFHEQESGYLAGYLAALMVESSGGPQVIGAVGGQKIPPVDRYIAGFRAGAKAANPSITVLSAYSQDFVAQDKCKEFGLNQIAAGSQVEFQVAGQCGLGTLDAAMTKRAWGIGVDADQAYLGKHILTSAIKKVDVAVFDTIADAKAGTYRGGTDSYFTLANGGAGLGKISRLVPKATVAKVNEVAAKIKSGAIVPPTEIGS
jgi:basic membrane protein A